MTTKTGPFGVDAMDRETPYLLILIEVEAQISFCEESPGFFEANGRRYHKRQPGSEEVVFYDWIINRHKNVLGIEIHLPIDHPLLESTLPLLALDYVDKDVFPRIFLARGRDGRTEGLEAFGDIAFYGSEDGHLAIMVRVDQWISPGQFDHLRAVACGKG